LAAHALSPENKENSTRFFLDADPNLFYHVLAFLRSGLPILSAGLRAQLLAEAEFLMLPALVEALKINMRNEKLTNMDLRGWDLSYHNLAGADLTGTNLAGVNLTGSDLTGADISGSILI
jgi:uncharacterized protein YjbI with pentapeptide repeats